MENENLKERIENIKNFDPLLYRKISSELENAEDDELLELLKIEVNIWEEHIAVLCGSLFKC